MDKRVAFGCAVCAVTLLSFVGTHFAITDPAPKAAHFNENPIAFGIASTVNPSKAKITDPDIAAIIVQGSRDAYYRTGRPCACPDDLARNGSRCGGRSAYSRPGGAAPYCYTSDVPKAEIDRYRTSLR